MKIPIYQVDAFTSKIFSGNPACVCPLEKWMDDRILQKIARENNVSETAFFVREQDKYHIRWFTPLIEVDLCGHATLASAFVLFNHIGISGSKVTFYTSSGELSVTKNGNMLEMDFPAQPPQKCGPPQNLINAFEKEPIDVLCSQDYFVIFPEEEDVRDLRPDLAKLKELDLRGVIVTAKGDKADFVSRFFAPKVGVDEDPVTGSAHCALIPYWSKELGKVELHAYQLSDRGGELFCKAKGNRVLISGKAITYLEGNITCGQDKPDFF
jgi:PhzF family phenazine biosynthesis protein